MNNSLVIAITGILILLFNGSGCAFKKSDDPIVHVGSAVQQEIKPSKKIDSDGDGVGDAQDKNPKLADIPKLLINNIPHVELGFSYKSTNSESSDKYIKLNNIEVGDSLDGLCLKRDKKVREKILDLQYVKILNPDIAPDEELLNEHFNYFVANDWKDQDYFKIEDFINKSQDRELREGSGQLLVKFKLLLENLIDVSEVSNIQLMTGILNTQTGEYRELITHPLRRSTFEVERFFLDEEEEFYPVETYSILDMNLEPSDVQDYLLNRARITISVKDFDYVKFGKKLRYSEVVSRVNTKTAKVIISKGDETEVYNVMPEGTLYDFLKKNTDFVLANESGEIESIGKMATTLSFPIVFRKLSADQMNLGAWTLLGDARSVYDLLKKNKTYIISYATAKELSMTKKEEVVVFENKEYSDSLELSKLRVGDVLTIELTGKRSFPLISGNLTRTVTAGTTSCEWHPEPDRNRTMDKREYCTPSAGTATIYYTQPSGRKTEQIFFDNSEQLGAYVSIGDKDFDFNQGFIKNNESIVLDQGKKIKFRFEVGKLLVGSREVTFKIKPGTSDRRLSYGYVGIAVPAHTDKPPVRYSHDTSRYSIPNTFSDAYSVTIKRVGMPR